ncbi:MAG TPA: nuclear transport factor 2 family protein [Longimicrobiaceae bacterium]|nr:nuclear transport factor 2 family protein [Longimicrobiaceae bacterium]
MRSTLIAAAAVLAAALPARAHAQVVEGQTTITLPDTSTYSRTARRILGMERDRSAAIARRDTAWLVNLYAPDFRGVAANGRRLDRDALFAVFLQDNSSARFAIDELEVREFGGTVLVTGRLRTLGPGGEVVAESRYLHVYLRRELHWWIVAAEGTAVAANGN